MERLSMRESNTLVVEANWISLLDCKFHHLDNTLNEKARRAGRLQLKSRFEVYKNLLETPHLFL
jgi:hypothetical protein